jgi:excisionase family DNA binding protein
MKEYLTRPEVADLLRVHPLTIRNWIIEDGLPIIRMGRSVRISRVELDRWIEARTTRSVVN